MGAQASGGRPVLPFLAGVLAGAAGAVLAQAFASRRSFSPSLIPDSREHPHLPAAVLVPGILGSELLRPDGTEAWLNAGNALGHHDLKLPLRLPLADSRDDLVPGGLIGVDAVLPRLFGFTEYSDVLELLEEAGFHRDTRPGQRGAIHHVFTYDWRRDLVESARALHAALEDLAQARGEQDARFNLIGHSMGGLVARYYLRFGTAEPDGPVTWAGARRIENLVLVATPNSGSAPALDAILSGNRVGLSTTTLAAPVIARMPAIYQILPPPGTTPLVDSSGQALGVDLLDAGTWERYGWGPFAPPRRLPSAPGNEEADPEAERAFLAAVLARARALHAALSRRPQTPCPARVVALGGDCLPTLARAIVSAGRGSLPRFEAWTRAEAQMIYEAGDGRVTRSSVLASHLAGADASETGSGLPEISHVFFGHADHHGIYREPTFQSVLLRLLLRPRRPPGG